MILLDVDPSVVKPGWTPLFITLALAVAIALLYLSLRKQFRKIDANFAPTDESTDVHAVEGSTAQSSGRDAVPPATERRDSTPSNS